VGRWGLEIARDSYRIVDSNDSEISPEVRVGEMLFII
jgi:hypothetical protein